MQATHEVEWSRSEKYNLRDLSCLIYSILSVIQFGHIGFYYRQLILVPISFDFILSGDEGDTADV